MNFELKKVDAVGGVTSINSNTSSQLLNITIGVVDCPYDDISSTKTIDYVFSNSLTIAEARAGIETFAIEWIAQNYPNI